MYGSYSGGFPLVVFDDTMDTALVLSPASTFMSATQTSFKNNMTGENTLTFGPMSSIEQVAILHVKFKVVLSLIGKF